MSGHRWYSIFTVCLLGVLTGCQSSESGRFAWNPFRKSPEKASVAEKEPRFKFPGFSGQAENDEPATDVARNEPLAEEQMDRLLAQGQQALQEERLEDARRAYTEVLDSSPDNATAHHGMAMASDLSQEWADAEYHYRQALRIRPRDANLLCDIGYSYLLQSRYSEASRYLNHALEINPQHDSAMMNLALLDLRQGNRRAAEDRIASRFGVSSQASQILAQLESQTGAVTTAAFKSDSATAEIPANASIEQVRELARQERIEAERRRATQGIPPEDLAARMNQDRPSVLSNQHLNRDSAQGAPAIMNQPASGNQPSAAAQGAGIPQSQVNAPQLWANAPIPQGSMAQSTVTGSGDSGMIRDVVPNANANGFSVSPQSALAVPANPSGYGQMLPSGPQNFSAGNSAGNAAGPGTAFGNVGGGVPQRTIQGQDAQSGPGSNSMAATSGSGPPMSGGTSQTPGGRSEGPFGRVVAVHSSGAFQQPPTSSVSYGQPMGFSSAAPNAGYVAGNSSNPSAQMPGYNNGPNGQNQLMNSGAEFVQPATSFNGQPASGQMPVYLDGLNAGPGAIFPIRPSENQGSSPVPGGPGNNGNDAVNMGNVSSPGANSRVNGLMYEQPNAALPSQGWVSEQQQLLRSQQLQSQRWLDHQRQQTPQSNGSHSGQGAPGGTPVSTWPNARPATMNPLDSYELQRQQLDSQYNRTLQQMDRSNGGMGPQFP